MHIGRETAGVACAIRSTGRLVCLLEIIHKLPRPRIPLVIIALVGRIDGPLGRHLDRMVREEILTDARLQREPMDPFAGGEHQDRARAVHDVTRRHLLSAPPNQIRVGGHAGLAVVPEDGEDRPHPDAEFV